MDIYFVPGVNISVIWDLRRFYPKVAMDGPPSLIIKMLSLIGWLSGNWVPGLQFKVDALNKGMRDFPGKLN